MFGNAVAAGDVDGDGSSEIVVGAYAEDAQSLDDGRVYIYSGETGALLRVLESPPPKINSEQFGRAVATGDTNGDGRAEVFVSGAERVYQFSGQTGALIRTILRPPDPSATPPAFGSAIATGDTNQDGFEDIAIGAWNMTIGQNTSQGRAYVFSGSTATLLATLDSPMPLEGANFGRTIAMGDVSADGRADVVVGAPCEGPCRGRAYMFSGTNFAHIKTFELPVSDSNSGAQFSASLAIGDLSSDGVSEVAIGAPYVVVNGTVAGRAYVFDAINALPLLTLDFPDTQPFAAFGRTTAVGDTDSDGHAEIVVGAPDLAIGGNPSQGRGYLFDGMSGQVLTRLDALVAEPNAAFGSAISMADTDGGGGADSIIGAPDQYYGGGPDSIGRAYVFSGPSDRDQDGFPDSSDACPDAPGPGSVDGCPPPGPPIPVGGSAGLLAADNESDGSVSSTAPIAALASIGLLTALGALYLRRRVR